MPVYLHRAQRSDALVRALGELLADPLPDPMVTEIVAVPARGIERWLAQRLSHRLGTDPAVGDGVCANVDFSSPSSLVRGVISRVSGVEPDADPWRPAALVWHVLAEIDRIVADDPTSPLAVHLGAGAVAQPQTTSGPSGKPTGPVAGNAELLGQLRRGRRFAVAQRTAALLDAYATDRPQLLIDWAAGNNTDGAGKPLAPQRQWQAELLRRVRESMPLPSPAERLQQVDERLRSDPRAVELPQRLSIFGATRMSTAELTVLAALAAHRDVHLWIPQPSPAGWQRWQPRLTEQLPRRSDDPLAGEPRHPLLRSLGRDSREFQQRLAVIGAPAADTAVASAPGPGLLGALQADIAADTAPPGAPVGTEADPRRILDPDDRSIQVHACHGKARQVEVLRDVLVGLLADDPTLQPRDIVVMCPDIESYAPLVLAAFGVGTADDLTAAGAEQRPSHPGTGIRVRLADRALRQTNPVLDVLDRLLELADSRMTASEVLDFAALGPVSRRFGFDADALDRLRDWVVESGVRWGLNATGRESYGLGQLRQNTWRAGLDRILLGVTMSDENSEYLGLAAPLDDVESSDIDLAGRLAELVDRLALAARQLTGAHPLRHWVSSLGTALRGLAKVPDADGWQLEQALQLLTDTAAEAHAVPGGADPELRLSDVRAMLADTLRGRPTRANFRTGELTICSMVPMRSVPHRVVCLLGLDDGEFPRANQIDGDDVLAVDPVVGERDRSSEDRQLLLDAIDAATEHLVLLYSGADERTGAIRPPAAALGEILDVVDRTAVGADGRPATDQVVVRHPLQPFDSRNFLADALGSPQPFSFDRAALAGARAVARRTQPAGTQPAGTQPAGAQSAGAQPAGAQSAGAQPAGAQPAHTEPGGTRSNPDGTSEPAEQLDGGGDIAVLTSGLLPPAPPAPLELADLVRFFDHPVKALLRDRLGITGGFDDPDVDDELAVAVDGLQRWQIGDRFLRGLREGIPLVQLQQAEYRRGSLPPGAAGAQVLQRVSRTAAAIAEHAERLRGQTSGLSAAQQDISVRLPDGRLLIGTVGPVITTATTGTLLSESFSKLSARSRMRSWITLLAAAASSDPTDVGAGQRQWRAVTVGGRGAGSAAAELTAPPGERARELLGELVGIRDRGLRGPLPLTPQVGSEYARLRRLRQMSVERVCERINQIWKDDFDGAGQAAHQRIWGSRPWSEIVQQLGPSTLTNAANTTNAANADDSSDAEPLLVGDAAVRSYRPLLDAEELS
ncbi:exodeoxyribonuclease V subunit gamma [Nakamurella aerolata]|uniref:RecBCD enzyme subunit RecC n=1 Tax=Nakamurella aerolata TaxID=1656892 RepID=A0A849A7G3_9ACTN|nr:exodeoxyribonuclease V subunit gamma [Nakamurella aerolata]